MQHESLCPHKFKIILQGQDMSPNHYHPIFCQLYKREHEKITLASGCTLQPERSIIIISHNHIYYVSKHIIHTKLLISILHLDSSSDKTKENTNKLHNLQIHSIKDKITTTFKTKTQVFSFSLRIASNQNAHLY